MRKDLPGSGEIPGREGLLGRYERASSKTRNILSSHRYKNGASLNEILERIPTDGTSITEDAMFDRLSKEDISRLIKTINYYKRFDFFRVELISGKRCYHRIAPVEAMPV
jgi:hypothetical protein